MVRSMRATVTNFKYNDGFVEIHPSMYHVICKDAIAYVVNFIYVVHSLVQVEVWTIFNN